MHLEIAGYHVAGFQVLMATCQVSDHSAFGIFGLSGIVVNDSIILVMFFKQLKLKGVETGEAIVEAACQRLRAVLLTSLTTIAD